MQIFVVLKIVGDWIVGLRGLFGSGFAGFTAGFAFGFGATDHLSQGRVAWGDGGTNCQCVSLGLSLVARCRLDLDRRHAELTQPVVAACIRCVCPGAAGAVIRASIPICGHAKSSNGATSEPSSTDPDILAGCLPGKLTMAGCTLRLIRMI